MPSPREVAIERAGGLCERCGRPFRHVHHKDKDHHNNQVANLMAVCTICHPKLHTSHPILFECPICGSSNTYRRISREEQVCNHCGHVWKPKKQK